MKREEIRWIPTKPSCESGNFGFITVDMNVAKPCIVLLLLSYVLSFIVALGEQVASRRRKIYNSFRLFFKW